MLWKFPALSETFVVEELRAMEELGIRPRIVAIERPSGEPPNPRAASLVRRATWLADLSLPVRVRRTVEVALRSPVRFLHCLAVALSNLSRWSLWDLWHATQLAWIVRRSGTDYLHAHFVDHAGEVAWFASRLTGVPYGVVVHGVDLYVGRMLCRKVSDAALPVTVCRYNLDQLRARCPDLDPERVLIKAAGLDPGAFRRGGAGRHSGGPPVVLGIGRLVPKKGFDVLLRAVARLRDDGVELRCRVVGDGRCREELESLIDTLGLDGTVSILGHLPPAAVRAELEDATLLAAPCTISASGDRDSMPVVIKEAMAMEVPVVASDDFGIPELVDDRSGVLVPRDDVDAFAAAIRSVLAMPEEDRAAMGRAGRAVVTERFDERDLVVPLVRAFERI